MGYVGEIISLGVACSWTVAALASEVASKKLGVFVMNVWRMALALLFSAVLIWIFTGYPYPAFAKFDTWAWLLASGVVGYFFGDWCLFNSYLTIGSRFGQLFMTLAPAFTALCAWVMIGQMLRTRQPASFWRTTAAQRHPLRTGSGTGAGRGTRAQQDRSRLL